MKETSNYSSSLSYFLPERGNIHLQLFPAESERSVIDSHDSPFKLINSQDPLARIFRGAFVTDYGSIIKDVNLLIQRDAVALSIGIETALTNPIIDQYWQQAMLIRKDRSPKHSMLLANQVDEQRLLPFAPLFFCRTRSIFFEPPCPTCGSILQLCKDDTWLNATGLQPYTTSIRRYLYCPSCNQANKQQTWYTLERTADDPVIVHDCRQLILSFGQLDSNSGQSVNFPCLACQHHNTCYGIQQLALNTIFTLSFYPFYMLITERDSLDGFQFLTMKLNNQSLSNDVEKLTSSSITENSAAVVDRKQGGNDPEIYTLLQNLAGKWQQELQQQSSVNQRPATHEITETMSIPVDKDTSQPGGMLPNATIPPTSESNDKTNDLSTETVLITSLPNHPPGDGEPHLEETVLLSGAPSVPDTHIPPDLNNDKNTTKKKLIEKDANLTETVILEPNKKP